VKPYEQNLNSLRLKIKLTLRHFFQRSLKWIEISARICYPLVAMQPTELRKKLNGVISFPVTPFKKDLSLDLDGLRHNLRSLLKHPVCAIVAPAGTGEIHCLSPAEHLAVVKTTVEEVNGKVPVLTGTGFNPPIAAELAKQAAAAGVKGILAFPPYYPSQDDEGITAYYKGIAAATKLGLIIYSRDWFTPSPSLVEKLAREIPNLIAWKDGQADIRRYQMIRQHVGDRLHWIGGAGDDMVPAYYSMGVRTYTSSIANVAPKLSLRLHDLAVAGHSAELTKLMNELIVPLYALRAKRKGYEVSVMKAMMDMIGLVGGPVRPPLVDLRPDEIKSLQATMELWRPWL
jgi:5-dehydro-4-deoxyglucarate dehydratase